MAIEYKIHPAVGVARVGNSPSEFFIGPEVPGELVRPPGGFKDAQCRVKRQAARFYIFAHDDVAGTVTDVTDAVGDVRWSIAPSCAKRSGTRAGTFDRVHVVGRLQRAAFNLRVGTPAQVVPAGEIRSDQHGRLIVLGGFGQAGPIPGREPPDAMLLSETDDWWDDTCESPVFAQFTVGGVTRTIEAWVVVAPPKFLPHQPTPVQFYDRRIAAALANGEITPAQVPVVGPGHTAANLDKAALENVSSQGNGIEVRSATATFRNFWLRSDPVRLDPMRTLFGSPGDSALFLNETPNPWHGDLFCGWGLWGALAPYGITDAASMLARWPTMGFMVDQNGTVRESERCDATRSITLLTPDLSFGDVPAGPGATAGHALRAIVFEVVATSDVTLEYSVAPAAPFAAVAPAGVMPLRQTVPATGGLTATVRFWIEYTTTASGLPDLGTVTITDGTQPWTITLSALSVPRRVIATALVLDRSGSMSAASGSDPTRTKHMSLVQAAQRFVALARDGDFVQLVRYDHLAQQVPEVATPGVRIDGPTEITAAAKAALSALIASELRPAGSTSIGSGVRVGVERLSRSPLPDAQKALLVMTDGRQNTAPSVGDVAPLVTSRTYGIGLGTPANTSAQVLQELSGNHGGYLLITDPVAPGSGNEFLLSKFFLQIQAGIESSEIVLDPDGELSAGREQLIPFSVSDADTEVEVILLCDHARSVDFRVITPGGDVIEPWVRAVDPSVQFELTPLVAFFRLALPAERRPGRLQHAGTWRAALKIGVPQLQQGTPTTDPASVGQAAPTHWSARRAALVSFSHVVTSPVPARVPFSLLVRASSRIGLRVTALQSGLEPGARVELHATLLDSGVLPVPATRAWAEVVAPDGSHFELELACVEPGRYQAAFGARVPGVYRGRVRAHGKDRLGFPFTREQTVTSAVWHGGSRPPDSHDARTCCCCEHPQPGPLELDRARELANATLSAEPQKGSSVP